MIAAGAKRRSRLPGFEKERKALMENKVKRISGILFSLAILAGLMLVNPAPAEAADGVPYVVRSWNSSADKIAEETKYCTGYSMIDGSTEEINGWYLVTGRIDSSKRLRVTGTANIVLADGARLYLKDGIHVPAGTTLNIYGQGGGSGELYCDADTNDNAAIGSDEDEGSCGTINIYGGKITADANKLGTDAAGIGGGDEGSGGTVAIYGGEITAIGGDYGAGIGGGDDDGKGTNGGTVRIYGGSVNAKGGKNGAGIGGGEDGSGADVEIYGGTVTTAGGEGAAGIGRGEDGGSDGSLTLGKYVTLYGGNSADPGNIISASERYRYMNAKFSRPYFCRYVFHTGMLCYVDEDDGYKFELDTADIILKKNGSEVGRATIKNPDIYENNVTIYASDQADTICIETDTKILTAFGDVRTLENVSERELTGSGNIKEEIGYYSVDFCCNYSIDTVDTDETENLSIILFNGLNNAEQAAAAAEKQTTSIRSAKALKGRKVSLKWKKVSSADGYQIEYSAKGEKTKKITVSGAAAVTKTVKKLKAGKTYSFRIRPYTKVAGMSKNIYGKWSKAKTVKVKK